MMADDNAPAVTPGIEERLRDARIAQAVRSAPVPDIQAQPQASAALDPMLIKAAAEQSRQQQPSQLPNLRPGMPLLASYIAQIIHPTARIAPGQSPAVDPLQRPSRGDATLNFLHTFLTSMSSGLEAAGHGPGAGARGFAGAYMAPRQVAIQNFQLQKQAELARSQVTLRQAQAEEARQRGGYYGAQAEATKAAAALKPVQIPDGQGGNGG